MRQQSFLITVEHDDSLFPDEGALEGAIWTAIHSRHSWFGPDDDVMQMSITTVGHEGS